MKPGIGAMTAGASTELFDLVIGENIAIGELTITGGGMIVKTKRPLARSARLRSTPVYVC